MASPTMVPLLIALLIFATTNAADIKINPAAITHTIVWTHGCHTDLGYSHQQRGIFAQLLHGESFENFSVPQLRGGPDSGAAAAPAPPLQVVAAIARALMAARFTVHAGMYVQ